MKLKLLMTLFLTQCLLSACSNLNSYSVAPELAIQHESLAKHLQDEAAEIQAKIDEHKEFLNKFESKRYVYGRHANDLKAHSQVMIRIYEQAVSANRKMAEQLQEMGH